ncbi:hypothetical protein GCM10010492_59160 [Saccharothrix mutabilis subsp. mutabilis]|uniref:Deoxyribonuclease NucA/NucB domain-containing protein n=1 Tax=Saccharothrix mutabilis subsp. mutabilis TaxID=66855 RepID=A0ABP3E5W7_9PSEU
MVPSGNDGGFVSPTLQPDGTVSRVQPEHRSGTVEEARSIAARKNAISDVGGIDEKDLDDYRTTLARAAEVAEPPSGPLEECLASDEAGKPGGRVLNRHFWCQRNTIHGEVLFNGKKEGEFTVQYRAAAVANPFTRQVHYFLHGDDYDTEGTFSAWSRLSIKIECVVLTAGCSVDRGAVVMDIGDWDDGEWLNWNISSDEGVATQQPEKVLRNIFTGTGHAVDDFGRGVELTSTTRPGIRCDSASYFPGAEKACTFTDVIPRLNYRYGQGYDEVVTHIKTAHENPSATDPKKVDKVVPGRWDGYPTSPGLHRVPYAGTTWQSNRNAKDRACRPLTGTPGQQCDEFPFAVTKEGAGLGDGNFSVKYVNGSQNGLAGIELRIYLSWDRILYEETPADGVLDEFWVKAG